MSLGGPDNHALPYKILIRVEFETRVFPPWSASFAAIYGNRFSFSLVVPSTTLNL